MISRLPRRLPTAILGLLASAPALAHDARDAHVHPLPAVLAAAAALALLTLAAGAQRGRTRWVAAAGAAGFAAVALLRMTG